MKYLKFVISLLLTAIVCYGLNTKFGSVPPIGKFLNPVSGIWQNEKDESINGNVAINGLKDKVTVHYDEQLIPHIFAENEHDVYFMQGWVHAQDRLFQMDTSRRQVAGTLSELFGTSTLETDVTFRTLGLDKAANNPGSETVGTITDAQIEEIAKIKMPDLNANDIEAAKQQIRGTARSMGIAVA